MISFEYPYMIWLILLPFLIRLLPALKTRGGRALRIPFVKDFKNIKNASGGLFNKQKNKTFSASKTLLWLVYACVVLALMKPVQTGEPLRLQNKGRDILLITDISTSMLEDDFLYQGRRLERMEAVRAVVSDFVQKRTTDRMGLILFGTRAYQQVPLTFDKKALLDVLAMMQAGMAGQSTSIGDALALGLKNLSQSKTDKNKQVIVLLTDGENNDGNISFPQAIKLAKEEGIKVYTVGIGSEQFSLMKNLFGISNSGLDEQSLKQLADQTKGQFFKADNLSELINVYREIDKLEPQDFEENLIYPKKQLYYWPLLVGFVLMCFGVFLKTVWTRRR
ncbi:MAG: VWA domain-containing protein [Alphaproteobacteria bacterium]|nr:VWA domain-containing protein [Alphaproteobacteria bacterium]